MTLRQAAARLPCRCRTLGTSSLMGRQQPCFQRSGGKNCLRTLWFEGFLFASMPGRRSHLVPCVPTWRYSGVLDGTGRIRSCGKNSEVWSPEGRRRANEASLKRRGGFKPSSFAFAPVHQWEESHTTIGFLKIFDPDCGRRIPCSLRVLRALERYFPLCNQGRNRSHPSFQ